MKKKRNKFKPIKLLGFILFIIMGAIGGFFGGKVVDEALALSDKPSIKLFILAVLLLIFILSIYLQIIAHELGHLIFGKLSGYKFISFRIGNVMLINENGRIKRKKFNIVGTGGQCLMMPPDCNDYNFPYVLYNLGGSLSNIAVALLCFTLNNMLPKTLFLSTLLNTSFILGIGFALINAIPMRISGITNDGYNVISLEKDKDARHAFWLQLTINGLLTNGIRLKDMPQEWFYLSPNADLKNPLICSIGVLETSYFHDKRDFGRAREVSHSLMKNAPELLELHRNELRCELLFYEIIGECRKEEIRRMYTKQLKKYIKATSSYVARKRLMYAYALLVDHNQEEAEKQLAEFEQVAKTYPYPIEIESEREILRLIENKVKVTTH